MIRVQSIVVCTVKSKKIVEVASIAAMLYPNARYYIVFTIPRHTSRTTYTRMYKEMLYNIAVDSMDVVEKILREKGVEDVKREIIYSRNPGKDFINFLKRVKADLIVAATPDVVGSIGKKLFIEAHRSHRLILLSTPRSRVVTSINKIMLLVPKPTMSNQALYIAFKLAGKLGADILLVTLNKPGSVDLQTVKIHSISKNIRVHIEPLTRYKKGYIEEILKIAEDTDLLVLDRDVFIRRLIINPILWFYKLSSEEEILLKQSPVPILYL